MQKTTYDVWRVVQVKLKEVAETERIEAQKANDILYMLAMEIRKVEDSYLTSTQILNKSRAECERLWQDYVIQKNKKVTNRDLQQYSLELHRKFAFPFACVFFMVFAFPVGLIARRSGRIAGFGIGLFVSLIYWGLLVIGHQIGFKENYSPLVAMWLPNFVVMVIGIGFYIMRAIRK